MTTLILSRYLSKRFLATKDLTHICPYDQAKIEIDVSNTEDDPIKISAYGDERDIACVCMDMHFMTLKKGPPVRSPCGHWFQLVDREKFWQKQD